MADLEHGATDALSALIDDELDFDQIDAEFLEALGDEVARERWYRYHLVGDILRSPELSPNRCGVAFLHRVEQRLRQEHVTDKPVITAHPPATARPPVSANADEFHWRAWALGACLSVVGAAAWISLPKPSEPLGARPQWAVSAPAVGPVEEAVSGVQASVAMLRDPHLDALLAAHRQWGGHSALQLPAGFLRNATHQEGGK